MRGFFRFLGKLFDVLYKLSVIFLEWPLYLLVGIGNLAISVVFLVGSIMEREPLIFLLGIGWFLMSLFWFYWRLPTFSIRGEIYYNRTWVIIAVVAVLLICVPGAFLVFSSN